MPKNENVATKMKGSTLLLHNRIPEEESASAFRRIPNIRTKIIQYKANGSLLWLNARVPKMSLFYNLLEALSVPWTSQLIVYLSCTHWALFLELLVSPYPYSL